MREVLATLDGLYKRLKSLPEDPPGLVCYGKFTEGAEIIIQVCPKPVDKAMPFGYPEAVVNGIHHALDDSQGLVEIESGQSKNGKPYIYSIVKTALQPHGVQYCLTLDLLSGGEVTSIQGFFSEAGTTGVRDANIFALARRSGLVKMPSMDGWTRDPYDPTRKSGFLMNLSEMAKYDHLFPQHPLSEARELIRQIVGRM